MSQTKLKVIETNNNKMDKENRNKSLEAAVGLIEKNYGKGSIMKLGSKTNVDIESISTGSLGLDIALGIGGVPKGRILEIYGPEMKNYGKIIQNCFEAFNAIYKH